MITARTIITPTTKASVGHDEDISSRDLETKYVRPMIMPNLEAYTKLYLNEAPK